MFEAFSYPNLKFKGCLCIRPFKRYCRCKWISKCRGSDIEESLKYFSPMCLENLLRNASLLNSNGYHNKALGWGIGLSVAAQGHLTEPVKDKNYLLFLDFPDCPATTLRVKDKKEVRFSDLYCLTYRPQHKHHLKNIFVQAMNFNSGKKKLSSQIVPESLFTSMLSLLIF